MKKAKLLSAAFALLTLFLATGVKAQNSTESKWRFGIGLDGLLPVGSLTNTANFGLGITPRLQYDITNKVSFTFTSGFDHFFMKKLYLTEGLGAGSTIENDLDLVPVKAGVKFFLTSNFYVAGETGLAFEVDNGGGDTKLTFSPQIGYASKRWDVAVRYENFAGDGYSFGIVGLRVAYGFGL